MYFIENRSKDEEKKFKFLIIYASSWNCIGVGRSQKILFFHYNGKSQHSLIIKYYKWLNNFQKKRGNSL